MGRPSWSKNFHDHDTKATIFQCGWWWRFKNWNLSSRNSHLRRIAYMISFPFGIILNMLFVKYLLETTSVSEIEMFDFSTLEWFILLMIVIVLIWILIVLQARSIETHQYNLESHTDHNGLPGDKLGNNGIDNT